jgi:hypothetical protein
MLTRTAVATVRKQSSWRNGFSTSPSFWAVASRISRKDIISDLKSSVPPLPCSSHPLPSPPAPPSLYPSSSPSHPLSLYVSVSLAHRLLAVGASFVTISLTTTLCIETDALRLFTVARTNKRVHPKLMFTHTTHDNSVAAPIRALAPPTHTSTKHTRVLAPVLLSLSHSLRRISNGINDHARARAWIRLAINECGLESYVASLAQDTDTLATYYEPWAFLRDSESMSKVILLPVALPLRASAVRFLPRPFFALLANHSCFSLSGFTFIRPCTNQTTHPPTHPRTHSPTHPPTHSHLLP